MIQESNDPFDVERAHITEMVKFGAHIEPNGLMSYITACFLFFLFFFFLFVFFSLFGFGLR